MTAEIIAPGGTIKLKKPELTAKLVEVSGRKLLIYTDIKKHGFFGVHDEDVGLFMIQKIQEQKNFVQKRGILYQAGHVIQLEDGSFIRAT